MKFLILILLPIMIECAMLTASSRKDTQAWIKYRESRGEHDCMIDETKNWLGPSKCAYAWECQGSRQCTRGEYNKGDGFC